MKNEYSYLSDWCHSAGTACLFSHRLAERREYVMGTILQYVLYLVILAALAIPLGKYIGKIMDGEKVFLSRLLRPVEHGKERSIES